MWQTKLAQAEAELQRQRQRQSCSRATTSRNRSISSSNLELNSCNWAEFGRHRLGARTCQRLRAAASHIALAALALGVDPALAAAVPLVALLLHDELLALGAHERAVAEARLRGRGRGC